MDSNCDLDYSRILSGPEGVEVYVPPEPPHRPEDIYRDFPPSDPPMVRYGGVTANYWVVRREGLMSYKGGAKVFSEEVMRWLNGIENEVEELIRRR